MSAWARSMRTTWDWLGRVPDAQDERVRRQAALTVDVLRALLVSVPLCVVGALMAPGSDNRATVLIYGFAAMADFGVLMVARSGRPRLAAFLITAMAWAIITLVVFLSGGLSANHGVSLVAVTMIAGTLLGPSEGIWTALGCVTTAGAALLADYRHVLPPPLIQASATQAWLATTFSLVVVAVLHNMAIRSVDQALEQHRAALKDLREARAENEHRAHLGAAVAHLGQESLTAPSAEALMVLASRCIRRFHAQATPFLLVPVDADQWQMVGPEGRAKTVGPLSLPAVAGAAMHWTREANAAGQVCAALGVTVGSALLVRVPGRGAHAWLGVFGLQGNPDPETAFLQAVADLLGSALERAAADERALRAQKLEAVGRLAGGIAHDFNNILTVVTGATAALREGNKETGEILDDLDHAARTGRLLNRHLLAFSQRGSAPPQPVNLAALVTDFAPLLRRLLGSSWVLEVSVPPEPLVVMGDPGQLEQVVLNLVVNARDATAGGTIRCAVRADHGGQDAVLEVVDHGCGMDDATRRRALQPFFTTKQGGTGLGLATVSEVATRFHGTLDIQSTQGRGTSVAVSFPRVMAGADLKAAAPNL